MGAGGSARRPIGPWRASARHISDSRKASRVIVKRDPNDILSEEGIDGLRADFDNTATDYHLKSHNGGRSEVDRGDELNFEKQSANSEIRIAYFGTFSQVSVKRWLIKGVLAEGETSIIIGPPGSWPVGTRQRVWLDVLIYTGLRRGDAVRLGRPHICKGVCTIKTEKTDTVVTLPILPPLMKTLDAGPCGELTFIAGEGAR
jgi:hypothetical protein